MHAGFGKRPGKRNSHNDRHRIPGRLSPTADTRSSRIHRCQPRRLRVEPSARPRDGQACRWPRAPSTPRRHGPRRRACRELIGARCGKWVRTTKPDPAAASRPNLGGESSSPPPGKTSCGSPTWVSCRTGRR